MPSLNFRLPGRPDTLGGWLASLLPDLDRSTRKRWIEESRVRVDGQVVDRPSHDCPAGVRVEITDVPAEFLPQESGQAHSNWIALIDEPAWPSGVFHLAEGAEYSFKIDARCDGLASIRLEGPSCDLRALCRALAQAGLPIVGDLERGGLGVVGGVRLVGADRNERALIDWPDEPAWTSAKVDGVRTDDQANDRTLGLPTLRVSEETARVIRKGHPWILPDAASHSATRFRAGTLVRVVSRKNVDLGLAHIEGDRRLAARLWSKGDLPAKQVPSVEARVARALARRRDLLIDARTSGTNAFRLIHGEGDGLPGLVVDRLGPLLRVLVTGRASDSIRERVFAALRAQLPVTPEGEPYCMLELNHVRGAPKAHFDRVRWISGGPETLAASGFPVADARFEVLERGLRFSVDPGWDTPRNVRPGYGLFLDQRENRARLDADAARGGDWLNLFAHTGAFSAALLAAGAARVTSVDLSAAYLKRLDANLLANQDRGVDPSRNDSVCVDGRHFLESLPVARRFAGIVLDPPTAAAAGRRFWSLSRDLEPILRRCIERLDSGGVLLVTQNRSGPPLGLDRILERNVGRAHRSIDRLVPASAGVDHPSLSGFPEGEPFEGWFLRLD